MNQKDFADTASGRLVNAPQGYLAFVPNPLPPPVAFDMSLALALSRADAALSELSGLGGQLPNPHLLISPYIKREAVLSSRIEGTKASLSDLLIDEIENGQAKPAGSDDIKEVRNYIHALEFGVQRLETLPLSLRLIREIHAKLMEGVRGERATPGEFRRSQNWIGPAGSTPMTAAFVPPPGEDLMTCLGDWENFLHLQDDLDACSNAIHIAPRAMACASLGDMHQFQSFGTPAVTRWREAGNAEELRIPHVSWWEGGLELCHASLI